MNDSGPAIHSHGFEARYDVIVVGAGHAGLEASHAAARMGAKTLLVTMDATKVALMSCNPAIGGLAKGQLAREIDALSGVMGRAIDATGIQFRMLNTSKGPAVRAPRAQADKAAYTSWASDFLRRLEGLDIAEGTAAELLTHDGGVAGIALADGRRFAARAVVICSGTFLDGLIHIGLRSFPAGRLGEPPALGMSQSFEKLGLETGRLKTGTPARLDRDSIDWAQLPAQFGDDPPPPFSFETERIDRPQVPCHQTWTTARTHEIIRGGLDRSPLYTGLIKGRGPRYCPSIEDKVVRFADRGRHQIFLEPEGILSREIYPNGISTSLPEDVQEAFIHSIPGLEQARIVKPGYAIEYTFCPPRQLDATLQVKTVPGLFFAGQLNATSGYEEAGAQGLMAGINAALLVRGEEPLTLGRHEAYIGVLIDDLITRDHEEPYRMFTSRAEYRLALRHDSADLRLTEKGWRVGLIRPERYERFLRRREALEREIQRLDGLRVDHELAQRAFERRGWAAPTGRPKASEILSRPDSSLDILEELDAVDPSVDALTSEQAYLHFRYAGYLTREAALADRLRRLEDKRLPVDFDYASATSLRKEAADKLSRFRPTTLGQASRIAGVSPADIAVLLIAMKAKGK